MIIYLSCKICSLNSNKRKKILNAKFKKKLVGATLGKKNKPITSFVIKVFSCKPLAVSEQQWGS